MTERCWTQEFPYVQAKRSIISIREDTWQYSISPWIQWVFFFLGGVLWTSLYRLMKRQTRLSPSNIAHFYMFCFLKKFDFGVLWEYFLLALCWCLPHKLFIDKERGTNSINVTAWLAQNWGHPSFFLLRSNHFKIDHSMKLLSVLATTLRSTPIMWTKCCSIVLVLWLSASLVPRGLRQKVLSCHTKPLSVENHNALMTRPELKSHHMWGGVRTMFWIARIWLI